MESLLGTFDDEQGGFIYFFHPEPFFFLLFLSFSSESELEDVLSLLFLDVFFCLNAFLFREGFPYCALPTPFSAGLSSDSPALPLFSVLFHYLSLPRRE